jgi:hypothetical protein
MKKSDSYPSVVRGVSQQAPSQRDPGRMEEQVNMVPDPVEGLCRRHGSSLQYELMLNSLGDPSAEALAAAIADTATWRTFEYTHDDNEYVLVYRTTARPAGSTLPGLFLYNRTLRLMHASLVTMPGDTAVSTLFANGISAITAVGKYVFMAGNGILPTASSVDVWGSAENQARAVVWVRGGTYSRKYTVTATKTDNTQVDFEYTTPSSSYQGALDTSGVPVYAADPAGGTQVDTESAYIVAVGAYGEAVLGWGVWNPTGMTVKDGATTLTNVSPADPASATEYRWDAGVSFARFHPSLVGQLDVTMAYTHTKTVTNPNYTKLVGDITNEYNTAVTQWIGTAAQAIQPAAIAESLRLAAVAAGLTSATRDGSTIIFDNVKGLTVADGGDGSLIRGVANEISSADQVSDLHYVGKVVKVRARSAREAYYLKATAKDPLATGYTEVIWVEGAGVEHTINSGLFYGVASPAIFNVASSAANMQSLIGGIVPNYEVSTTGDADTSPLPYFVGREITYLGVFQDRLMVGAGAVVRASRVGDYLNFFRTTVLSVLADDSLEMLSQGADDDVLRHSVLYDKDLVIFGDKRQYVISGRSPLTPTSANMPTMSSHSGAGSIPPVAVGGLIFYAKRGVGSSSVHQIQPGRNVESPESFPVSSQLNTYILGDAVEITKHAEPSALFVRTAASRQSLYVFHFLDFEDGRRQDAWHRWDIYSGLGSIMGISQSPAGLLVYTLRYAFNRMWFCVDLFPLTAGLSTKPYLDSQRPWIQITDMGSIRQESVGSYHAAFDDSTEYHLLGADIADAEELLEDYPEAEGLYFGAGYQAYATLTNPYMRDRNDRPITTGQLVVAQVTVSTAASSGFDSVVASSSETVEASFNGRLLGDPNNILGRVPITDAQWPVPVGREIRDYRLTLKARLWHPLTITLLEWVGQAFNRTQR